MSVRRWKSGREKLAEVLGVILSSLLFSARVLPKACEADGFNESVQVCPDLSGSLSNYWNLLENYLQKFWEMKIVPFCSRSWPVDKSNLLSIFTNKVLLEYSHAHLFPTYCQWLLPCYNGRVKLLHTNSQIFIWSFTKSFPPTILKEHQWSLYTLLHDSIKKPRDY